MIKLLQKNSVEFKLSFFNPEKLRVSPLQGYVTKRQTQKDHFSEGEAEEHVRGRNSGMFKRDHGESIFINRGLCHGKRSCGFEDGPIKTALVHHLSFYIQLTSL